MSVKPRTNFPIDGHRTAVIGTDPIMKLMKIKKINWPYRGTFQSSMETKKTPIHEALRKKNAHTSPLLLLNNLIAFLLISVKISGITNLTHKLIFKT